MDITYISREAFKASVVNKDLTSSSNATVDRLLQSKSRAIERDFHRHFYPQLQTRYYDWPPQFGLSPIRLYLNADLLAMQSVAHPLVSGGVNVTSYFLEPINYGPPYSRIEVDLSQGLAVASFQSGSTPQRSVVVQGIWGFSQDETPVGSLDGGINSSQTDILVTDSSAIGAGDLLHIDNERLIVAEMSLVATTATLSAGVTDSTGVTLLMLNNASNLHAGEIITVDSERFFIESLTSDAAVVKRAYQGSVNAAHLINVAVYAPRTLTVVRASAGTAAASHLTAVAINKNVPPQLIADLCLAEAISSYHQEKSGYARTIGQGDTTLEVNGRGLSDIRKEAEEKYERMRGPVAV